VLESRLPVLPYYEGRLYRNGGRRPARYPGRRHRPALVRHARVGAVRRACTRCTGAGLAPTPVPRGRRTSRTPITARAGFSDMWTPAKLVKRWSPSSSPCPSVCGDVTPSYRPFTPPDHPPSRNSPLRHVRLLNYRPVRWSVPRAQLLTASRSVHLDR